MISLGPSTGIVLCSLLALAQRASSAHAEQEGLPARHLFTREPTGFVGVMPRRLAGLDEHVARDPGRWPGVAFARP
jgi:hypothetical protein